VDGSTAQAWIREMLRLTQQDKDCLTSLESAVDAFQAAVVEGATAAVAAGRASVLDSS
jgi:hypothetical protein